MNNTVNFNTLSNKIRKISSLLHSKVKSNDTKEIKVLTQTEYDNINIDSKVLYLIKE